MAKTTLYYEYDDRKEILMPTFRKWKSIGKFSDVYALSQKYQISSVKYRGKIKIHGTNAAIQFENGDAYPQKRSDFITVYNDNCGFALFVSQLEIQTYPENLIVYGEWAGPNVQKVDAVTQIENKSFFVFSIFDKDNERIIIQPEEIENYIKIIFGKFYEEKHVYVLPWQTECFEVDFSKQSSCQSFVNKVMRDIDENIAVCDPYIKEKFGVEGPGEGYVFYPIEGINLNNSFIPENKLFDYIFKSKTESHSVQKSKNRNHVAPEVPDGIYGFIEMFFTEQRFEQMLNQIGGKADRTKTSVFLKAVMTDVYNESKQEILLCDFTWKIVPKYAQPVVKKWWFEKCNSF